MLFNYAKMAEQIWMKFCAEVVYTLCLHICYFLNIGRKCMLFERCTVNLNLYIKGLQAA